MGGEGDSGVKLKRALTHFDGKNTFRKDFNNTNDTTSIASFLKTQ